MGAALDKTVARAVSKKWIPTGEAEAVKAKIAQLGSKYGFSVDDFAIATITESYGMQPNAGCNGGGCFGIIQFCSGTGLTTIGETKSSICSKGILQQLDSVDKFFGAFPKTRNAGSLDLADLYLAVLYPSAVGTKDLDKTIPAGRQAAWLHGPDGRITKNSLIVGLRKQADVVLCGGIGASDPAAAKGSLPGDYASTTGGGISAAVGLISAVFNSSCTEPFPVNFNLKESLTYAGCKNKLASAVMGQSGLGYPAQAMQVLGQAATGLGQYIQGAPVCPGCLIWPFEGRNDKGLPTWLLTSPRSPNRNGRPHHGVDFGCPTGTPLLASGDGKITTSKFNAGGYGWFITIDHGNNLFTRYGHMREQGLPAGTQVKQGQVIGYSGETGAGTGPHLHFEVRKADDYGNYNNSLEPSGYCK